MLFDFQAFVEELREKPEKKQIVEKYESLFGPIQGDIKDQIWYTEYLTKFEPLPYETPEELKNDFDRDLLEQLVIWSFSSDYELKKEEKKAEKELYIAVKSWDQSVVKTVSELRSFIGVKKQGSKQLRLANGAAKLFCSLNDWFENSLL